jgi:hypothetical protein
VAKSRPRFDDVAHRAQGPQNAVPREGTQTNYYPHSRQEPEVLDQVLRTVVALLGRRTVHRWSAPNTRGDVTVLQLQPVVAIPGNWFVAKPGPIERAKKPVPGSVPRKYTAGSVTSMRCRGQAANEQASPRIAEPRYRPAPVFFVTECGALVVRNLFPPRHQPRASAARNDPLVMNLEERSHTQSYQVEKSCKNSASAGVIK